MRIDPSCLPAAPAEDPSAAQRAVLAIQLQAAGDDTRQVARALRHAAADAGLAGPAGHALAGLAGRVADDVTGVARGCDEVAAVLRPRP